MSTDVRTSEEISAGANPSDTRLYRFQVDQYLAMIEAGVFSRGPDAELLGGMIFEKMTKNVPHDFGVGKIAELLRDLLGAAWIVREEKSIVLNRWSRPEPDVVIARGSQDDYRRRDPAVPDVPLLIEVADTTYAKDRGIKWRRYAAAKVPNYWILNINERQIETYGDPAGKGGSAVYRSQTIFGEAAEVPVVIDGVEVGRIAVRDVLA